MSLLNSKDKRPIHFVGIAGAGMNALAELFVRQGAAVTGCDLNPAGFENLSRLNVSVQKGHDPSHIDGVRALVISSAVPRTHPEIVRATELGIPVIRRAEALAEAVSAGRLVAIAGTHGKTTTTVMTTIALASAGMDPTGVVGGRVSAWGGNLRAGSNEVFVVEADEYDRSFLALSPDIAVITNIEADHLDIYRDVADIHATFEQFASQARCVVLCADDEGARALKAPSRARRVLYGVEGEARGAEISARHVAFSGAGSTFKVYAEGGAKLLGTLQLSVPGLHNVRNALAAVAAGLELGKTLDDLAPGLASFRGVERRFEILGDAGGITVVDDYAHHPTEITATLDAARRVYPGRRIVCAFQPHLFSRTRDFATEFGVALAGADAVLLTEIYPARERPIEGVDAGLIENALRSAGGTLAWRGPRDAIVEALRATTRAGDVVFTVGAGDITAAGHELFELLNKGEG